MSTDLKFSDRVQYGGNTMRSKLERSVARSLDTINVQWEYEPRRFRLADEDTEYELRSYLPDFKLVDRAQFLEVKGVEEPKDKARQRLFVKNYGYELVVIKRHDAKILWKAPRSDEATSSPIKLLDCPACEEKSFAPELGDWSCRRCGEHRGDDLPERQIRNSQELAQ